MSNDNGWVKLHRSTLRWGWYDDHNISRTFLYLLMSASYNEYVWMGKTYLPGQLPFGFANCSKKIGITERSLRTVINKLKATGEIAVVSSNQGSVITINNWEKYQSTDTQNDTRPYVRATDERHASDMQATSTKKVNNIRTIKKVKNIRTLKGLELEIQSLWNEASNKSKLKACKVISSKRKIQINKTISTYTEMKTPEDWKLYFQKITESSFLCGEGGTGWIADFDWAIKHDNVIKVVEGKYDNNEPMSRSEKILDIKNPYSKTPGEI